MPTPRKWKSRLAGLVLMVATVWYLRWLLGHLNMDAWWLAVPFAAGSILVALLTMVTVINHWNYAVPKPRLVAEGEEASVAVIIPTLGEPTQMVARTARSVLDQDYARERINLIISDDGHRPSMKRMTAQLQGEYPDVFVAYHEPPFRGDEARRGEAKAGNLNSALDIIEMFSPDVAYIETRDADDLVGDRSFLRQAVGQLEADPRLAFVQTIKEAVVSAGDPFGNQEPLFYRNAMIARNAANAAFPCGSGLLWRRDALEDIGGFPTWNLVEDLQSGVEALRRGWRGLYLPIVGAVGQIAPEDLPNAIKQRGTWAIDTMRMSFWGQRKGLSLRQHIQFSELGLFYLASLGMLVFVLTPIISLATGYYPLVVDSGDYVLHLLPYAAAIELLLVALSDGLPYEALWRARQIWLGMAPVYARATWIALWYGPNRKPAYRVTRKRHEFGLYLQEVRVQLALLVGLLASSGYHLATRSWLHEADVGTLLWAGFFALALSRMVANAWHGWEPWHRVTRWLRSRNTAVER